MRLRLALFVLWCASPGGAQDLRDAARLDSQGKCAESEPVYREALARTPVPPALLNNAGNHYLLCGDRERARQLWERLIAMVPGHGNANLQLARMAAEARQGAKALIYLTRLPANDPAVRLVRAEAWHWTGRRAGALAELDALAKDPEWQFAAGDAFARLELWDRAEIAFQDLLRRAPADFDLLFHYGRAAARARHYDRARAALESAVRIEPGRVDALVELGLAAAAANDSARAVYVLAQAGERAPARPDIALALARAAEDAGFYGDAALAYDRYLALRPGDDTARRDRARVLAATGSRREEGLLEMATYIAKHPRDPVGHYHLAQFTWQATPEKSLEQLATALRLDPRFVPAHVSRAWLLHRLGRSSEAVPHLQAALRVTPRNVRALDQLGLVYLALDRPADAERVLRQASAVDANDAEVRLHLGRALMALGRDKEAQPLLAVRRARQRDARVEPGMIELATLPESERRSREIERFRRLSQARPDDAVLQLNLAVLLLADGQIEEAERAYGRLLGMNAEAEVNRQAGQALLRAARYALAVKFLERTDARVNLAAALLPLAGPEEALGALGEAKAGETGDVLLMRARILHAAGRREEAGRLLTDGLRAAAPGPEVAAEAAAILVREDRVRDALALTSRAVAASPDHAELLLTHAAILGVMEKTAEAEKALQQLERRWPEWHRPYLVHGLLLLGGPREAEGSRMIRIAVALGAPEPAARCGLREVVFGIAGCA